MPAHPSHSAVTSSHQHSCPFFRCACLRHHETPMLQVELTNTGTYRPLTYRTATPPSCVRPIPPLFSFFLGCVPNAAQSQRVKLHAPSTRYEVYLFTIVAPELVEYRYIEGLTMQPNHYLYVFLRGFSTFPGVVSTSTVISALTGIDLLIERLGHRLHLDDPVPPELRCFRVLYLSATALCVFVLNSYIHRPRNLLTVMDCNRNSRSRWMTGIVPEQHEPRRAN